VTAAASPVDPGALIRTRGYIGLLVLAGVIGIIVSVAGWLFLEATAGMQRWLYNDLPTSLGFSSPPLWWPIPFLALAGLLVGFAIDRLPGHGGHRPAGGLKSGSPTAPAELPGVLLAAIAGIGLGIVLGPEAPLIALGGALGVLTISLLRRGAPDQVRLVIGAAGSFAAISTIFGNPLIGAVIIVEAAGLGGPTLPLVLLPGLVAAGIGSIVFLGLGGLAGLSSSAYALAPLNLPPSPELTVSDFVWAIVLAIVAAIAVRLVLEIAWSVERVVIGRALVLAPVAGIVVAVLAAVFVQLTGQPFDFVLTSGQDAMPDLATNGASLSAATIGALLLFKGLAWAVSLGSFRGGPTFPAMFLGMAAGLLVANLTGLPVTPAIAIGMAATTVSMLRLPLSAVILASVVAQAGLTVAPLIVVSVVVAYIVTEELGARRGAPAATTAASAAGAAGPAGPAG
jgi:H+/Cl- antiporter ClcA